VAVAALQKDHHRQQGEMWKRNDCTGHSISNRRRFQHTVLPSYGQGGLHLSASILESLLFSTTAPVGKQEGEGQRNALEASIRVKIAAGPC